MQHTVAKREFKKRIGQANHLLITILIGLNAIERGDITSKPESFSTSWNPIDPKRSAQRARYLALSSSLTWAVDSLDVYLSLLNRNPKYVRSDIQQKYDGWGQSIHQKVKGMNEFFPVDAHTLALVDVLITWRNNSLHSLSENKLSSVTRKVLESKRSEFSARYRGMEIDGLAQKAEAGAPLSFKEVASLIKATQDFVIQIDRQIIGQLNLSEFYRNFIIAELKTKAHWRKKYFEKSEEERTKFVRNILQNFLSFSGENDTISLCMSISKEDLRSQ